MRARVLAFAAAAGVAAAVVPVSAAATKPLVTDPTGDANGINSQPMTVGVGPNPNISTGPASYAPADIVSVAFTNNFVTRKVKRKRVRVPISFTVTLTLAGAPDPSNVYYAVTATSRSCPDGITFEYSTQPSMDFDDATCFAYDSNDPTSGSFTNYPAQGAVVKGNTISWTVLDRGFPAHEQLTHLGAYTGAGLLGSTPTLDQAASAATFTIGK